MILTALLNVAVARDVLLVVGDVEDARERAHLVGAPAELEEVSWGQLTRRAVLDLSPGATRRCDRAAPDLVLPDTLEAADAALRYHDLPAALSRLEAAEYWLPCARSAVSSTILGRLFFLRGALASREGEAELAAAYFRRARHAVPDLRWDPAIDGGTDERLDRATSELFAAPPARLLVSPDAVEFLIDASEPQRDGPYVVVPAGSRFIQIGPEPYASALVELQSGEVQLMLLAGVPAPEGAGDRELIGRVLTLSGDRSAYLVLPDEVWSFADGHWVEETARLGRARGLRRGGHIASGAGLGVTLAGAGLSVYSLLKGRDAGRAAADATNNEDFATHEATYDGLRSQLRLGHVVTGVGITAMGVGLTLSVATR